MDQPQVECYEDYFRELWKVHGPFDRGISKGSRNPRLGKWSQARKAFQLAINVCSMPSTWHAG